MTETPEAPTPLSSRPASLFYRVDFSMLVFARVGLWGAARRSPAKRVSGSPARVESRARQGFQRGGGTIETIDAGDKALAARQLAVERGHRLGKFWLLVIEPGVDDSRPGQREALQFES